MTETTQQPPKRMMRSDLWILLVLGVIGIVFFLWKYDDSFPSASIDLSIPKNQILDKAKDWSRKMGYNPEGAVESTVFSYDDDGKTFLEHEMGQARANEIMRKEVPTWYWRTRFCKEFQQEEINIAITTDGRLNFVDHQIPNDAKLTSINHAVARKMAEDFAQQPDINDSLKDTELIDDGEIKQKARTDHYFTWKHNNPDYKDGKLYTYVYISGDKLTQYNHYLHVPQRFDHQYAKMRAWNETLKKIANVIFVALSASIAFIFIWAFAQGQIRWRLVIVAGIVTGIFEVIGWFDNWPTLMSGYSPSTSVEQYVSSSFIKLLAGTATSMIMSMVFVGAIEPIYRLMFPKKVAIERLFTSRGLRSESVFQGLLAGLSVFGIHTAYVVCFYLMGQRLGFWDPLDIRDAGNLSHLSPVFDAINTGLFASTMEEMMYRVLCLAIFQRLTKNFWLANILQAASWAFMHSDYPQEPPYVRGIELTIGGTFYGWVLRRFGLVATILSHYTYDAFLGVTPLVMSASPTDRLLSITAILPGIIALLASVVLWRIKGPLEDEGPLENDHVSLSAKPPPVHQIEPEVDIPYTPLTRRMRGLLIGGAAVLIIVSTFLKPHLLGYNNHISITCDGAFQIARDYLNKQGISTAGMQHAVWLKEQTADSELQYVLEKVGYERARKLEQGLEPRLAYRVRFFKELDPTEYYVLLSGTGQILSQWEIKDEDIPGPKLTSEEAQKRVDDFLRKYHPNLYPLALDKQPTVHDYKARRDFDVTYTAPQFSAGDADFKVDSSIVGGDVSGYTVAWRVPDEWTFARDTKRSKDQKIAFVLRIALSGFIGLLGLWIVADVLRAHAIRWKPAIVVGAIFGAGSLIHSINGFSQIYREYRPEEALSTFVTSQVVEMATGMMWAIALGGLFTAFAYGAFRRAYKDTSLAAMLRQILPTGLGGGGSNKDLWLDAVIVSFSGLLATFSLDRMVDYVATVISPAVHIYSLSHAAEFTDEASICLKTVVAAVVLAGFVPLLAGLSAAVAKRLLRGKFVLVMLASTVGVAMLASGEFYWQDYVMQVAEVVIMTALAYFFIARAARKNLLAYALFGYGFVLIPELTALVRIAPGVFQGDIAVISFALVAPIVYTIWLWVFFPKAAR